MLEEVLKIIMEKESKDEAVKYIKQNITNLLQNKIDIGELVITKAITKKVEEEKGAKHASRDSDFEFD
jgi:DNA polymerase elongation subunit (family B)